MLSLKSVKLTAVALASCMSVGLVGMTATAAEASPRHHAPAYEEMQDHEVTPLSYHRKQYSEGERNTAAIVGAVVGAIIAKNT